MNKSKILLVDDHPLVRDWLAQLINREPDLAVCGEAGTGAAALAAAEALKPDLAIVDLSMPDTQGTELVRELGLRFKEMAVLVLSVHDESLFAMRAIRAGAKGYVTKQEACDKIREAIRRVLSGQVYVSDSLASKMITSVANRTANPSVMLIDSLSERQLDLLRLMGHGHANPQIARELKLSVKTVEGYIARIKEKLGIKTANELLQFAIKFNKTAGD